MITRNTGADIVPLHVARPSYPGARLRALRDARARRERETPRPWDAERLRADLRALHDVRNWTPGHDGDLAAELRRRGWDDDRLAAAQVALRDDLRRRVHPTRAPVTAGATVSSQSAGEGASTTFAPAVAPAVAAAVARTATSGRTLADRRGAAANIVAALRMGLDPATLWPGQLGFPGRATASGLRNRPAKPDQEPVAPRSPRLASRYSRPGRIGMLDGP